MRRFAQIHGLILTKYMCTQRLGLALCFLSTFQTAERHSIRRQLFWFYGILAHIRFGRFSTFFFSSSNIPLFPFLRRRFIFPIPVCQCYFTMTTHTACDSFHLKHCECVKCNVMYNTCVHKCVSVFDWVSAKDINTFYRWIHELNFRLNRWVLCMCVRTHAICLGINTKLWRFMELQPWDKL